MARILIVYHSQTGTTERMALAVAEGAGSIEHVEVMLKRAGEATLEDLLTADGLAVGTPENRAPTGRSEPGVRSGAPRAGRSPS